MFLPHFVSGVASTEANPWPLDKIVGVSANMATVIALVFAGIQMRLMSRQLRDSRASEKVSRSLDFGRRWNDLEFVDLRTDLYLMLLASPSPDWTKMEQMMAANPKIRVAMRLVLNFYEEMAILYNRDYADRQVLYVFFKSQIDTICDKAKPYMDNAKQEYERAHPKKKSTYFTELFEMRSKILAGETK
jgi:hypothetical protein